ncbi:unnamed protein product [Schistosoma margrebowiei]|uniref:Uncharacterized protein n=1 Tax=Schistosoma margrebowiei TaxID=48269 RepID=A0A183M144_9TREM|nr:unnamed protein product [Schistosoma margrebowiei]
MVSMKSDSRTEEFISDLNYTRNIEAMVLKLPMQEWLKVAYNIVKGNPNDDKHADVVKGKFNSDDETARISYGSSSNDNIQSHDGYGYRGSSSLMCPENHSLNQCQKSYNNDVRERREFIPRHELSDVRLVENHVTRYRGFSGARLAKRCG